MAWRTGVALLTLLAGCGGKIIEGGGGAESKPGGASVGEDASASNSGDTGGSANGASGAANGGSANGGSTNAPWLTCSPDTVGMPVNYYVCTGPQAGASRDLIPCPAGIQVGHSCSNTVDTMNTLQPVHLSTGDCASCAGRGIRNVSGLEWICSSQGWQPAAMLLCQ
jgi:hypothetical protein